MYLEKENIYETGICLTNSLVGTSVFVYGNSMIYPSMFLREVLNIKPSIKNPLVWVNKDNEVVMYLERFVSPFREAVHENYFRQPIMSRWICNKEILNGIIKETEIIDYQTDKIERMPFLG